MISAVEQEREDLLNSANKLAKASLSLALIGWLLYLLQWCFDLTLGLLLAAVTAGAGSVCGMVLDILPFFLWISGIITGHAAFKRLKQTHVKGKAKAAWGLGLSYFGLFFTLLLIGVILTFVAAGVHSGWFGKIIPGFHFK